MVFVIHGIDPFVQERAGSQTSQEDRLISRLAYFIFEYQHSMAGVVKCCGEPTKGSRPGCKFVSCFCCSDCINTQAL